MKQCLETKFYLLRNKNGRLYLFEKYPPYLDLETGTFRCNPETGTNIIGELPDYIFPEVTWETGLKIVELKLKE
ncbi:MAG: hypothetical protein MJZ34_11165 [Paludibacteraceae bacterium]|nr:hypothetical protein [Paludibacteraceae bacterium]